MSRGAGGSYGHRILLIAPDAYRICWTVDRRAEGSRIASPIRFVRLTDKRGAERFCKRWGLVMPMGRPAP